MTYNNNNNNTTTTTIKFFILINTNTSIFSFLTTEEINIILKYKNKGSDFVFTKIKQDKYK